MREQSWWTSILGPLITRQTNNEDAGQFRKWASQIRERIKPVASVIDSIREIFVRTRDGLSKALNLSVPLNTNGMWTVGSYPMPFRVLISWIKQIGAIAIFVVAEFSSILSLSADQGIRQIAVVALVISSIVILFILIVPSIGWSFKSDEVKNKNYKRRGALSVSVLVLIVCVLAFSEAAWFIRFLPAAVLAAFLMRLSSLMGIPRRFSAHGLSKTKPQKLLFYNLYWAMNYTFIVILGIIVAHIPQLSDLAGSATVNLPFEIGTFSSFQLSLNHLQDPRMFSGLAFVALITRAWFLDHLERKDAANFYLQIDIPSTFAAELSNNVKYTKRLILRPGRITYSPLTGELILRKPGQLTNLLHWAHHIQKASGRPLDVTGKIKQPDNGQGAEIEPEVIPISTTEVMQDQFIRNISSVRFAPKPKFWLMVRDALESVTLYSAIPFGLFLWLDSYTGSSNLEWYLAWMFVAAPIFVIRYVIIQNFVNKLFVEVDMELHRITFARAYGGLVLRPQTIFFDIQTEISNIAALITMQHILSHRPTVIRFTPREKNPQFRV